MNAGVRTDTNREFSLAVARMRRTLRRAGITSDACAAVCDRYRHALLDASSDAWNDFYRAVAALCSHRPANARQHAAFTEIMRVLDDDFGE